MRRLIINITLFLLLSSSTAAGIYWLVSKYNMPNDSKAFYVWGDSQMYQGVDLQYLSAHTPYTFYSAALHGASLYDFLVFCETVPEKANVFIAISKPALLRKKESDRNWSAISPSGLSLLLKNNYSVGETFNIFIKNIQPHQLFQTSNKFYDNSDKPTEKEAFSIFESVYNTKPTYFSDKKQLYVSGIKKLKEKHCKIIGVQFPIHDTLLKLEQKSVYSADIHGFIADVKKLFSTTTTINIPQPPNVFYDYTHLNKRGAEYLSKQLVPLIKSNEDNLLITVICNQ